MPYTPFNQPRLPRAARALIVTASAGHATQAAQALDRSAAWLRVEQAGDTLEALRRSLRPDLSLVVLDWRIEDSGGIALVRHLSRMRIGAIILAFDDTPSAPLDLPVRLHAWSELDTAIESAAARLRHPAGEPGDPT